MKDYKKVLIYFQQNPFPGKTGTHKRCLAVIDAFQKLSFQVALFSHWHYGPYLWDSASIRYFEEKHVLIELYRESSSDRSFISSAFRENSDVLNLDLHCPPDLKRQFQKYFFLIKPDVLYSFYAYSSGLILGSDLGKCVTINDSIDLVSLNHKQQQSIKMQLGTPPYHPTTVNGEVTREDIFRDRRLAVDNREFVLYDLYDCTLAISAYEADQICKNTRKTHVHYTPLCFSPVEIDNQYTSAPVFVGANNPFNIQACLYFGSRVLPSVLTAHPEFRLDIVGDVQKVLAPIEGLNFKGYIDDIQNAYKTARFAVSSVIGGTGMSAKVVEAMAHGVPVVALKSGTQENLIVHGVNGFLAADAEEFATFACLLYENRKLCAELGRSARRHVAKLYNTYKLDERLTEIVHGVMNTANASTNKDNCSSLPSEAGFQKISAEHILSASSGTSFRLLFDSSVLGLGGLFATARTGIYRAAEHLARGLAAMPGLELVFCATQGLTENSPQTVPACQHYLKNHPVFHKVPFVEKGYGQIDVFHSPFHALPMEIDAAVRFLTVYDLIPIRYPEYVPPHVTRLQQNSLRLLRPTDRLFSISRCTQEDICRWTGVDRERIHVTHLAADPRLFHICSDPERITAARRKYRLGRFPYILSLCTLEPRKNIDYVIRAFSRLARSGQIGESRLVLVGAKGWDFNRIFDEIESDPIVAERILSTGYVPDEDLAPLYSGASVFAYMSIYEGFGLPPLEAMQCGTPVITSNTSSLPEVVGDAGIMLDPKDLDGLSLVLKEVLLNEELREEMSRRSLAQASRFTWDLCVQKTIDAYKNALTRRPVIECCSQKPITVIDGVIFQLQKGRPFGISRYWKSLLSEIAGTPLADRIVLLDRGQTTPVIAGIRRRRIPAFRLGTACQEADMLDAICREEGAGLFLSTYYTFTKECASLLMLYDMIPECFDTVGPDAPNPEWRDKFHAIANSTSFAAISNSTARDLVKFYPQASRRPHSIVPCAVSDEFRLHTAEEIAAFRKAARIDRPYFLLVGRPDAHKNWRLFFKAFSGIADRRHYAIVMAGGRRTVEPEFGPMVDGADLYAGFFSDRDLSSAYSGAAALVFPSRCEGFGLPILEAMQSGCPVITCPNSAIPEVAGQAALYVDADDVESLQQALCDVQRPEVRATLVQNGLNQAQRFSWKRSASHLAEAIMTRLAS